MQDVLLGFAVALLIVCTGLLAVVLLIALKIMHGVQTVLDIAGASQDEDDEPTTQESVNAPGAIPMPTNLRDRLQGLPPPTDLSNGTFGGRRGWGPPPDDKPAA